MTIGGRADTYRKTVLPNGVRVVTESLPWVRSVAVGIWVETGSRVEPLERGGISHLIEPLVFKGTETRAAEDIARGVVPVGVFRLLGRLVERGAQHVEIGVVVHLVEKAPADTALVERIKDHIAGLAMLAGELALHVVDDRFARLRGADLQMIEATDVVIQADGLAGAGSSGDKDVAAGNLFRQKHGSKLQRLGCLLLRFLGLNGRLQPKSHLVQGDHIGASNEPRL